MSNPGQNIFSGTKAFGIAGKALRQVANDDNIVANDNDINKFANDNDKSLHANDNLAGSSRPNLQGHSNQEFKASDHLELSPNQIQPAAVAEQLEKPVEPHQTVTEEIKQENKILSVMARYLSKISKTLDEQLQDAKEQGEKNREAILEKSHAVPFHSATATSNEHTKPQTTGGGIGSTIGSIVKGVSGLALGGEALATGAAVLGAGAAGVAVYNHADDIKNASKDALKRAKRLGKNLKEDVHQGILAASKATGISEGFLLSTAAQESSFDPNAHAKTSTARGLYQFLDSTWAAMVKKYGKQYGIGIQDRNNPRANAIMGALYAKENKNYLQKNGHSKVTDTDLYLSHFLGAGGANKFLNKLEETPNAIAANDKSFKLAAKANKQIFYDHGRARTFNEVYSDLGNKVGDNSSAYASLYGSKSQQSQVQTVMLTPQMKKDARAKVLAAAKKGDKQAAMLIKQEAAGSQVVVQQVPTKSSPLVAKSPTVAQNLPVPSPGHPATDVSMNWYMNRG